MVKNIKLRDKHKTKIPTTTKTIPTTTTIPNTNPKTILTSTYELN
jgi:hypothetical protein